MVQEAADGGGGQLPLEDAEDVQLPLVELLLGDGVVCVDDELVRGDGHHAAELGGQEEADRGQELELVLPDAGPGEEGVQVGGGQEEDLGRALLVLAHLQHPVRHDLPHVGRDLSLDGAAVVHQPGGGGGLLGQHVGQHPPVPHQHPVLGGHGVDVSVCDDVKVVELVYLLETDERLHDNANVNWLTVVKALRSSWPAAAI